MNNYDFYVENVERAKTSAGSLEEQADIYATSWEAAKKRVQASLEDIYTKLINDDFFIDLTDGFNKVLEGVNSFIDGLGGVKGVLMLVSSIFMRTFAHKMPQTLAALKETMLLAFGQGPKIMEKTQEDNLKRLQEFKNDPQTTKAQAVQAEGLMKISEMQKRYSMASKTMSEMDKIEYQQRLQNIKAIYEEIDALEKEEKKYKQRTGYRTTVMRGTANQQRGEEHQKNRAQWRVDDATDNIENLSEELREKENKSSEEAEKKAQEAVKKAEERKAAAAKKIANAEKRMEHTTKPKAYQNFARQKDQATQEMGEAQKELNAAQQLLEEIQQEQEEVKRLKEELKRAKQELAAAKEDNENFEPKDQFTQKDWLEQSRKYVDNRKAQEGAAWGAEQLNGTLKNLKSTVTDDASAKKAKKKAIDQAKAMKKSFEDLSEETHGAFGEDVIKALDEYIEGLENAEDTIDGMTKALDGVVNVTEKLNTTQKNTEEDNEKLYQDFLDNGADPKDLVYFHAAAEEEAYAYIDKLSTEYHAAEIPLEIKASPVGFSDVIMSLTSELMAVQSAILTISSSFDTLGDEASTGAEKVGAFIGIFTSGISVLQGASQAIQTLKASSLAASIAEKAMAKGFDQAKAAAIGFSASLGILLAVILAIVAAYKIWQHFSSQKSPEEENAERAAENLKQQEENLERVKSRYEEIKKVLDDYESVQNTLKNLTTGTEEWKDQVEELNKQIIDLITTYPELNDFVHLNEDGILTIDSDKVEEKEREELIKQQQQTTVAKIDDIWAKFDLRLMKMADTMAKADKAAYMNQMRDYIAQKEYGKSYSSLTTEEEDAVDAKLGEKRDDFFSGDVNQSGMKQKFWNLADDYFEQGESVIYNNQEYIEEIAAAGATTRDNVIGMLRESAQNKKYEYTAIEAALSSTLQDNEIFQNSKYKNLILEDQAKQIMEWRQGEDTIPDVTKEDISKWLDSAQADIIGYGNLKFGEGSNATIKKRHINGDLTIEYTDPATDEKKTIKKSKEEVANEWYELWRNQAAFDRVTDDYDYAATLEKFANYETLLNNIGGISKDSKSKIISSMVKNGNINLAELSEDEVRQLQKQAIFPEGNNDLLRAIKDTNFEDYWNKGGQLGANSSEYAQAYETIMKLRQAEDENHALFSLTGKKDSSKIAELAGVNEEDANRSTWIINNVHSIYDALDEENKKLFAATLDLSEDYSVEALKERWEEAKDAQAEQKLTDAANQYGLDSATLSRQAKEFKKTLDDTNTELQNSADVAADMAIANQRLNKGVKTLTDDWEDWKKALKGTDKTTQDWAEAALGVEEAIRDILRLGADDVIPEDFLKNSENIDLLDQIANGSEEAVEKLHFNLTKAQIDAEELTTAIKDNLFAIYDNLEPDDVSNKFEELKTNALSALNQIREAARGVNIGSELGNPEQQKEWAEALNEYAMATKMTVDQMNSFLTSVGVQATVDTVQGDMVTKKIPITQTTEKVNVSPGEEMFIPGPAGTQDSMGTYYTRTVTSDTKIIDYKEVSEPTMIPQISFGGEPSKPIFKKSGFGTISPSSMGKTSGKSGGGGGSSSKPQKKSPVKAKKKDDEIERYHEISNIIKDQEKIVDRLNKSKDDLYGANRLKAMDKEIAANEILIQQNQILLDEVQQNLALDRQKAAGYGFTFDEAGLINNYDEIMQQKMDEWLVKKQAAEDAIYAYEVRKNGNNGYDEDGSEKLALDEASQKVDDDWEEFKDSLSQYEETYEKVQEVQDYIDEKIRENMQKIFEKIEYTLTIRLELSEQDLSIIEQRLARLSDTDYTKTAERLALLSQQAKIFRIEAEDTKKVVDELTERYNLYLAGDVENGISQENYLAALKEKLQSVYEYENSLREGITSTGEELRNQFNLIDEKLESIYEKIQRRLDFAEFYKDISKIVNGETDYDTLNQVIDKQIKLTQVELDGLIAERDMWSQKRDNMQALLDSGTLSAEAEAQARESLAEIEGYIADANSNIQSDIQEMAELAQEEFTNAIEAIVKEWQDANFGESLDSVLEEIDLRNRAQEELLTKTNQVYETNKLIRQAEKDIAATSNKRAKQAYEEYINKAKQKQEQKELTQLELDLLTAEYEITKAQIALEEAKDAKDTVRLTRDSEGNFGYVYTANQDNINDAQQALEDATNNYYNIALEGAKSSSEQIYQLQQDWLQRVKEINQDATLSEEEKEAKIAEIDSYYETMIEQQRDKYYIAKAAVEESSYEHKLDYDLKEIESAEEWFNTHDELINDMADIREEYGDRVAVVADYVKKSYNNETDALEVLDAGTQQYSQDLDKLIPQMEDELTDAVDKATLSWFEYAKQLKEVIALNEQMTGSVEDATLKETYKNDYAQRIKELLAAGYSEDDPTIQKLLKYRLEKLGGVDDTDYKALIDAADNDLDKQLYTVLRNYKKSNNNWMQSIQNDILSGKSLEEYQWKYTFRDDKLEEMYGTADARTTAQDVEDWINEKDWFADITAGISEGVSIATTKILSDIRDNKQINLGLDPTTEADLQKWLVEDSGDFLQIGENILKDSNYNWDSCLETLTNIAHWQDEKLALLGQVGADTLSELYKWNEENKPKTETSNSNSINDDDWVLGTVSRPFEVGENGNGGSISNNSGDAGGVSYGLPQFATNTGSAKEFANWLASNYPEMGSSLKGLKPGTSAFNSAWKEIYNKYGIEFEQIQMDYAWDMFGAPWAERAQKKTGIDFTRSRALKELAYSTANQYGAAGTYVLPSGLNASMSDEEIVTAIQNYKLANVNSHFRSSNAATRAGVRNRIPQELESLLQLIYEDASYDTGGYTGDWGPEGRAAILHEKELVLNAEDTKNILTSVGIIREISKALDNSALWSALSMANLSASYIAAGGRDTLQQQVEIHADFPNVTDHNEIEMAIDNLINAASQYAYRG